MPLVELPSGQAIEFPEGVTPEQMTGALRRDFPQFYAGTQLQPGDIAGEEARQKPTVADTTSEYPGMPRNRMESFTVGTGEVREELFNPRITFPKFVPQEGEPAAMTYGKEAVNILAGIPEFMSSDVGLAGLAVAPAAPLLVGGVFLADTLKSLGEQIKSSYENWSGMSDTQKRVAITDLAGTGAFSVLLGHGVRRGVETRFQPVKSAGRQLAKEIKRTELPPAIDAEALVRPGERGQPPPNLFQAKDLATAAVRPLATGPRPAKEIKSELVQRLEEAIAKLPPAPEFLYTDPKKVQGKREFYVVDKPSGQRLRVREGGNSGGWTIETEKLSGKTGVLERNVIGSATGERGSDFERIAKAKAEAEANAQAAKEFEAKNQPDIFGMGGAVPEEFAQSQTTATSIKNAATDAERIKRGLPPAMEAGRKEFGQTWDEAMARIDADPTLQDRLIAELQAQPRALSDVENALLLHRQVDLQNLYGKFTRDLAQAFDDSQAFPNRLEEVEAGKARVQAVSDQLQTLYDVTRAVGTEQGRGLAARKMLAYEDFSLAKMEMEKRAAKGGAPLTDAERGELVRIQERLEQTQAAFDAYREQQEVARANRMTDEAIADMQAELKRRPSYDPRIVKIAEEIVVKLEKSAESASARLKEKFRRTNTGLDPTIVYDLGVVGAAKIARMGLDVTRFGIEMVKEFGEGIEPYLKAAWDRANLHLENEGAKYGDKAPQVKQLLRKQDAMGQRENVIGGLKKAVAEEIPIEMQGDYVRKLAESFVKAGIKEREALIDAVHKVLTDEVGMEITRRETMDAISGYGKFKPLNPDAVKATLRDLRGQMQQVAKLEDIQNRTPLKKTGVQRREPSNEERRLVQQVNEAKRRFGVVVSDPARQLKSALDAIKTRLKNSIADIEYQINTKERIVKSKSPSPFDAETQLLEARRDNLRAQLDELLPKPGLTPEQQAAAVARTLERTIADYERRITAGDVAARKSRPVMSTPQLEALRARRDAVRAEWEELRANSEAYQWQQHTAGLERQKTALEQAIAAKTKQLTEGVPAPAGQEVNRPADPMLEQLMQQRDALNAQLAALRRKPEAQKYAEAMARKLSAMQQQIAERQAKLAAGDYTTTGTPRQFNRPLPPDLEIARQQLEAVNAQLAAARKGPQLSPEARALKNLKARLAQATANYKERLAKADFAPRKRNEPPRLDAEALKLKAEHEIAWREFHPALIHDRMANRSTGQKVYAGVKEALNLPRNMLSSWDVSAVLRQGGFIATGNPLRAGRALAPMFRALASERAAVLMEQEILSRPNAPLYKAGKLYLAPHEALHLSAMEEQIMSRMAGKIPGLRASNRAYITFLNRVRADSFDALVASVSRGKDGSLTPKELQALANYINVATGRGELGKANAAAETLATVFFSPRLLASRFQLIAGQPFYRGTARTRYAIAKEYGKFLAGIGVVYALGTMAGATVETDTRSSDFGKLKFGNTRVDVLGGLSQVTTLLGRLMTSETITARGAVRPIRGDVPYGSRTAADVIAAFLRSKLSPVLGNVVDVATGKNVVGEPVTPGTVAQNMTVPLSLRDLYEVMRDEGMAMGTALGILSLFGYGLQHYGAKQATITQ